MRILRISDTKYIAQKYLTEKSAHSTSDTSAYSSTGHGIYTSADCTCTSGSAYQIFKDHVPANDKSNEFSDCNITVHVSWSCSVRNPDTKFCIADTYKTKWIALRLHNMWCFYTISSLNRIYTIFTLVYVL